MSQNVVVNRSALGAGTTIGGASTISCQHVSVLDVTIAASASDVQHNFRVDVSQLAVFAIYAESDMTIKTNSSGSPVDTIVVNAGETIVWLAGEANAPISGDMTDIYVTSTSGGTLKVLAGYSDASP